jgi:hypothetical protein
MATYERKTTKMQPTMEAPTHSVDSSINVAIWPEMHGKGKANSEEEVYDELNEGVDNS